MDRSLVSGPTPQRLNALFGLDFSTASYSVNLATECKSLTHYTKVRRHGCRLRLFCMHAVSGSISSPPGFFSPFPHGTGSLSVDYEYLALEDGPPIFRQGISRVPPYFSHLVPQCRFSYGAITRYVAFPFRSLNNNAKTVQAAPISLALLWESRLISFPAAT